ncbi:recombinase family protein [Paraburkholderia sp. Ac-20336]|uniref:recombinase family protein n=1 Tax=Burkholderiaceae TaxID=119060 RepID=UPI001423291B|nr:MULTISPECIES: recombinase family protein [Burkholderiaceae]MBN3802388.1 recombinase family protein [Paraburkholderia sp. Ac-20336]MBN3847481.1 recombinase family protein [Paraburkholderia sp. Ac-20342]NIF53993.1 recombinase family protein [Burkholderia sp. Ax-1724]NIF77428.1 recombinase family protein [Paraburkholderia sp. Cy-641]
MKIGYARVSTDDQNLDLQLEALRAVGCVKVFTDHGVSGSTFSRPGLDEVLDVLKAGDTLVVWRLDRLGRSIKKLIELVETLGKRKIQFVSITECIDTTSAGGTLLFHIMAALAQFERSLIGERTRAGMRAAKARGQHVGRRHAMTEAECVQAHQLLSEHSTLFVAQKFEIHPKTLLRSLRRHGLSVEKTVC